MAETMTRAPGGVETASRDTAHVPGVLGAVRQFLVEESAVSPIPTAAQGFMIDVEVCLHARTELVA